MRISAAVALMLLTSMSTAQASRHCLNRAEAARTWPTRVLVKDDDGCWTYEKHRREPPYIPAMADGEHEQVNTKPPPSPSPSAPTLTAPDLQRWADTMAASATPIPKLLDRWPDDVRPAVLIEQVERHKSIVPRHDIAAVIFILVLSAAIIEVLFGGYIKVRR